jgi:hypothetical protein
MLHMMMHLISYLLGLPIVCHVESNSTVTDHLIDFSLPHYAYKV